MKLAIVDIDGIVCDSTARFAKAEEAKQAYYRECGITEEEALDGTVKQANNLYWQTAFTPDLVQLDRLIDGVHLQLERIERAGYRIYFLTSRPETLRRATFRWLRENLLLNWNDRLIMKPISQQFVKTVTWKAGIGEVLVRLRDAHHLLFVDDEPAHCEAVAALDLPCDVIIAGSLQEAVQTLQAEG